MAITFSKVALGGKIHWHPLPTGVLTFSVPTTDTVTMGFNLTNAATSTLTGGRYGAISYSSSNTAVATVSSSGAITPISAGTSTITATQIAVAGVNNQATQTYTLTVLSGLSFDATLSANRPNIVYATANTWSTTNKATSATYSNGNLTAGCSINASVIASMGVSSGKWYWETTISTGTNYNVMTGVALSTTNVNNTIYAGQTANSAFVCSATNGSIWNGSAQVTTGVVGTPVAFNTIGTVIGVALDLTHNYIAWYKNGTLMQYCPIPSGKTWYPALGASSASSWSQIANFGNTELIYAPPTNFTSGIGGAGTHTISDLWTVDGNFTVSGTRITLGLPTTDCAVAYYPIPLNSKVYWETMLNYSISGASLDNTGIGLSNIAGVNYVKNQPANTCYTYAIGASGVYNGVNLVASAAANPGNNAYTGVAINTTPGAMTAKFYNTTGTLLATISIPDGTYYPIYQMSQSSESATVNFGASSFHLTPPTGYTSLNSNLQ